MPEYRDYEAKPNKSIPNRTPYIGGENDATSWNLERQRLARLEALKLKAQIPIEKQKTVAFKKKVRNFFYNLIHRN